MQKRHCKRSTTVTVVAIVVMAALVVVAIAIIAVVSRWQCSSYSNKRRNGIMVVSIKLLLLYRDEYCRKDKVDEVW